MKSFIVLLSFITVLGCTQIGYGATLTFDPAQISADVGDTLFINVRITDADSLTGLSMFTHLDYRRFQVINVLKGSFFNTYNTSLLFSYYHDEMILDIGITILGATPGSAGISGSGIAARIMVKVLACGSETWSFVPGETAYYDSWGFPPNFFNSLGTCAFYITGGPPNPLTFPVFNINEDSYLSIDLATYLNDPYAPADFHIWQVLGGTSINHVVLNHSMLTITPPSNWYGFDNFVVMVTNPCGYSQTGNLSLNVISVDDPPVLSNIPNIVFYEDGADSSIYLNQYVTDIDSPIGSLTWNVSVNQGIQAILRSNTRLVLKGLPDWFGNAQVAINASSSAGHPSNTVTIHVTVLPVNDPPHILTLPAISLDEDQVNMI